MATKRPLRLKDNLNRLIEGHSLSLHQLAKRTNINKSSLHNYVNGVLPQGLAALLKLAECFEVSIDELLFGQTADEENTREEVERYEITVKKIAKN